MFSIEFAFVIRFVRLLIRHVGGRERVAAGFELVEPLHPKVFEIEQMAGLLLN